LNAAFHCSRKVIIQSLFGLRWKMALYAGQALSIFTASHTSYKYL
jgi:hypothetical protein